MRFNSYTVIIINKLIKTKEFFMLTELNLYVALLTAFAALAFSIRLGISLYQST
jgi:hypothetical protein